MQHPFGDLTRNFRLRKFRGQQPAGPAGDGETLVFIPWSKPNHLLNPAFFSLIGVEFFTMVLIYFQVYGV